MSKRLLVLAIAIVAVGVRYLLWLVMGEPLRPSRLGILSIVLIAAVYAVFGRDARQ